MSNAPLRPCSRSVSRVVRSRDSIRRSVCSHKRTAKTCSRTAVTNTQAGTLARSRKSVSVSCPPARQLRTPVDRQHGRVLRVTRDASEQHAEIDKRATSTSIRPKDEDARRLADRTRHLAAAAMRNGNRSGRDAYLIFACPTAAICKLVSERTEIRSKSTCDRAELQLRLCNKKTVRIEHVGAGIRQRAVGVLGTAGAGTLKTPAQPRTSSCSPSSLTSRQRANLMQGPIGCKADFKNNQ